MNGPCDNSIAMLVESYLDGLMSPDERAAFESRLASDNRLAQELSCQRRINASLKRSFVIPPLPLLQLPVEAQVADNGHRDAGNNDGGNSGTGQQENGHHHNDGHHSGLSHEAVEKGAPQPSAEPSRFASQTPSQSTRSGVRQSSTSQPTGSPVENPWLVRSLVGLASLAIMTAALQFWPSGSPASNAAPSSLDDVYTAQVNAGFQPQYPFTDEATLLQRMYTMQHQGVAPRNLPPSVRLLGLSQLPSITFRSQALLMEVDGQPVLVALDKATRDRQIAPPPASCGLHQFRRQIGDLVFYEISPFDESRVLSWFELIDLCLD